MPNEEYALVIDFLPRGKSSDYKTEPIAQVIGTEFFTLLELIPKEGETLKAMDKIYVGKEERDKVNYIKGRICFKELTSTSASEIENAIEKIIKDNSERFLKFFNTAASITIRRHQLELLPGLGKKHMLSIIKEREIKPFESYEDIEKRVHLLPNPVSTLVKRILSELEDDGLKYYLFVRPPSKKPDFRR